MEGWILLAICAADTGLTVMLVNNGLATEANPLLAWCFGCSITVFCLIKMVPASLLLVLSKWHRKRNPGFTRMALRLGIAGYLLIYSAALFGVNAG